MKGKGDTKRVSDFPFRIFAFGKKKQTAAVGEPPTGSKNINKPSKRRKPPAKEDKGGRGFFSIIDTGRVDRKSQKPAGRGKGRRGKKDGQTGWFSSLLYPWSGFAAFNTEWKEQMVLAKRIKKLEKEVARDSTRGQRAKVAQYRYDALKTLEEVEAARAGRSSGEGGSFDPVLAGKSRKSLQLEVEDAMLLRQSPSTKPSGFKAGAKKGLGPGGEVLVRPEDADGLLHQLEASAKSEQRWARFASAGIGASLGVALLPSHDVWAGMVGGGLAAFLTTTPGIVGDAARMAGYSAVSVGKAASALEQKYAVLHKLRGALWKKSEASGPFLRFELPFLASWRNAYGGEGFLHPGIRPAPPMRDAQYVEYLQEVKRWVEVEEQEVLQALRRKEDERVRDVMEREERREKMQQVVGGLWQGGAAAATKLRALLVSSATEGGKEGRWEESRRERGMEDDLAFLKRFSDLDVNAGRTGRAWEEGLAKE